MYPYLPGGPYAAYPPPRTRPLWGLPTLRLAGPGGPTYWAQHVGNPAARRVVPLAPCAGGALHTLAGLLVPRRGVTYLTPLPVARTA